MLPPAPPCAPRREQAHTRGLGASPPAATFVSVVRVPWAPAIRFNYWRGACAACQRMALVEPVLARAAGVLVATGGVVRKLICKRRIWSFRGWLRHAFVELSAPSWRSRGAHMSRCGTVAVSPAAVPRPLRVACRRGAVGRGCPGAESAPPAAEAARNLKYCSENGLLTRLALCASRAIPAVRLEVK